MYDNLHNLDAYIDDSTLVLNLLRGLNKKFDSLKTVLKRTKPFPSFCKAQNDLQLEELMLDAEATSGSASAFTRPPPPSVRLALRLPPAVAVAVVAAAAVAVRLPPAAARERATLPGPSSTTLGLAPSTCGQARPWVLLRPVHRNTSLPSSLHHSTALRHSRRGPPSHPGFHGLRSGTHNPSLAPLAQWSSPTPTPPPIGWQTPAPPVTPHPTLVTFTLLALGSQFEPRKLRFGIADCSFCICIALFIYA
jgi:hypothetical protein